MPHEQFHRRSELDCSAAEAFAWHLRPGAFARLAPPWQTVEIDEWVEPHQLGSGPTLRMRLGPVALKWIAQYTEFEAGHKFRDRAVRGPFAYWDHLHEVTEQGEASCWLDDRVEYDWPGGAVGRWLGRRLMRSQLDGLFSYRHRMTADDLAAHHRAGVRSMKIIVAGSSGLVGSALIPFLTAGGHTVTRLVRGQAKPSEQTIAWDPDEGRIDAAALEGADAVIHLGGAGIADKRWSPKYKALIRSSRENSTKLLSQTIAGLAKPPKVFVCASAIGVYGDQGEREVDESSALGQGFLADVGRVWEESTAPAAKAGVRVVNLRLGVVLSAKGGALAQMLTPFKLGVGGVLGSGQQYMSWVALDDVLGAILHALATESLSGPVNVVAPRAVTNREFTKTLGRVLSRPTIFPMPGFAARLAFGEMADALLLASTRVVPKRLLESHYVFRYPELEDALRYQLGKIKTPA